MKDKQELRADIQRAEKAKAILNSPLVEEYFSNGRLAIMQRLETSEFDQDTERELILTLKAFGHLKEILRKPLSTASKPNHFYKNF